MMGGDKVERPKRHGLLRSSEVTYLLCTTMSTSLDVLPRSNEEYGTREYWYNLVVMPKYVL
jgi:hypothetical protein